MSMTREEAKQILSDWDLCHYTPSKEAAEAVISAIDPLEIISALRGPTREMVERMRGEWIHTHSTDNFWTEVWKCPYCGFEDNNGDCFDFCPECGQPKTDEAVDMILERWKEAMVDEA